MYEIGIIYTTASLVFKSSEALQSAYIEELAIDDKDETTKDFHDDMGLYKLFSKEAEIVDRDDRIIVTTHTNSSLRELQFYDVYDNQGEVAYSSMVLGVV